MTDVIIKDMRLPRPGDLIRFVENCNNELTAEYISDSLISTFHLVYSINKLASKKVVEDNYSNSHCPTCECTVNSAWKFCPICGTEFIKSMK